MSRGKISKQNMSETLKSQRLNSWSTICCLGFGSDSAQVSFGMVKIPDGFGLDGCFGVLDDLMDLQKEQDKMGC